MTGFNTDAATLATASHRVQDVRNDVMGQIRVVISTADELRGGWSGLAANKFTELITRYDHEAQKLAEALKEIADMLRQSGVTYSSTEDDQAQTMNAITHALG